MCWCMGPWMGQCIGQCMGRWVHGRVHTWVDGSYDGPGVYMGRLWLFWRWSLVSRAAYGPLMWWTPHRKHSLTKQCGGISLRLTTVFSCNPLRVKKIHLQSLHFCVMHGVGHCIETFWGTYFRRQFIKLMWQGPGREMKQLSANYLCKPTMELFWSRNFPRFRGLFPCNFCVPWDIGPIWPNFAPMLTNPDLFRPISRGSPDLFSPISTYLVSQ